MSLYHAIKLSGGVERSDMCVRFALSRKGCRGFLRVVERAPRRGWVFLEVGGCWRDNNIFIRGWLFAAFRAISIVEWAFSAVPRFVENVPFGRVCFDWSKVRNVHNNKILEYLYPMKTDSTITCTINYSLRTNRLYIQKISLQNKLVKQTAKIKQSFVSHALCCCPNQRAVSCRPFLCWEASETYRKGGNNYYTHFVEQQCSGH